MTEIDEFKAQLRGEAEAAMERIREMQAQAAEQYREMQANYAIFLDLSRRIQEAIRPWIEAFAESLPGVTPVVTERDSGPAGRVFHGVFVTFSLPRSERCRASITLRFGLEAGVALDGLTLFYDLEIVPVFVEFERHDQIALPLDPSSVGRAIEWFQRKALAFAKTYVSLFFNPDYQKGSEVPDVVLGRTFPRAFAKGRTEYHGVTYHFLTEESQKAFEQDPTRYVGGSSKP
jgi:YHS domain-containing protein